MTRQTLLAFATLAAVAGTSCSREDAPPPAPPVRATAAPPAAAAPHAAPVPVFVLLPDSPSPEVEAWARELGAAIAAGHGGLVMSESAEDARVVVRIDAVETNARVNPEPPGEGEVLVMRGAILDGESSRAFSLAYRGSARPQAEALARNLRRFAAEGQASAPEPPPADGEAGSKDEPD